MQHLTHDLTADVYSDVLNGRCHNTNRAPMGEGLEVNRSKVLSVDEEN